MSLKLVRDAPLPNDPAPAARDGDAESFRRLYADYAALVHGIALAHVGPADADDVVQETFVRAWRKLGTLEGRFGPWVAEIARNVGRDLLRRRRPTLELHEDHAAVDPPPRAEAREVLKKIQALPEAYRETLVLRLVEGMMGPEIAERTGLTPGSVRVNLHRGMELLRASLREKT